MSFPPIAAFKPDSSWLKAGQVVERGGVYRVHHYAHRMPHSVTIPTGIELPPCRTCGHRVQFAPVVAGDPLMEDSDFVFTGAAGATE